MRIMCEVIYREGFSFLPVAPLNVFFLFPRTKEDHSDGRKPAVLQENLQCCGIPERKEEPRSVQTLPSLVSKQKQFVSVRLLSLCAMQSVTLNHIHDLFGL